ncbi:hypothetical protein HNQ91_000332 [Filimonas zeae]|uniref:Beta-barrel porin-2, OmpL-like. bbp2 n=1 Tax=Filimonas zeae TaxID=1737353 RepID=A0A917IMQ5_9BACT|nr:outer membrane beta-barrel protein [Filimonas zeae]MDR6337310.1 hypothetical protein [Filimonas zeae]GGH57985.1 hypothetical protein GCM10011379_03250 [Filimonas zeae]
MLQKLLATGVVACTAVCTYAQDSTKAGTFTLSGNADAYYRYNFSKPPVGGDPKYNSITSFTKSHNSFELGMASLKAEYTKGKAGVVADLGFGNRAEEFAYNDANTRLAIKQLYVTYSPSSAVKLTLGSWATHVGYEVLDPYLNRNYSMSYMFSFGPFSHTGVKADISLGGTSSLMLGVANPTDLRSANSAPKTFLGQFATGSVNGKYKAYLNFVGGKQNDLRKVIQGDVVLTGAFTSQFSLALNGTLQNVKTRPAIADPYTSGTWWGAAGYANYDFNSWFGATARLEYVKDKDNLFALTHGINHVWVPTISANFKIDNLTIIPEFRLDAAKNNAFEKSDGTLTKSSSTLLLAATYHF